MVCVLEKISEVDLAKISSDFSVDNRKRKLLEFSGFFSTSREQLWVVDRDNDFYIFKIPSTREKSSGSSFYVYGCGRVEEIFVRGLFGNLVEFDGEDADGSKNFISFINIALPILGRFGLGVSGELDVVDPEFKEGF